MTSSHTNRNLGLFALVLGTAALIAGEPLRGHRVTVDPREFAARIQNELDHVSPQELSDWITKGNRHFRVIDLRSMEDFSRYHVPGAERKTLPELVDAQFGKHDTLVLYSDGGVHSTQAMFLLWTQGYDKVFMLKGGFAAWEVDVLHRPASSASTDTSAVKSPPQKPARLAEEEKFRREC